MAEGTRHATRDHHGRRQRDPVLAQEPARSPKQLLRLSGESTMLQQTVARIAPLVPAERILIITGADQAEAAAAQLPDLPAANVVAEPCPRDTAACVGAGGQARGPVRPRGDDDRHAGRPRDRARRARSGKTVRAAVAVIDADPRRSSPSASSRPGPRPATATSSAASRWGRRRHPAASRGPVPREARPATAEQFLAAGRFAWNSGIFVWRARTILDALREHRPALAAALDRVGPALGYARRGRDDRPRVPPDGAGADRQGRDGTGPERPRARGPLRLERRRRLACAGRRWCPPTTQGNAIQGHVVARDTSGSIIISDDGGLVATLGVDDLVVVHSGKATLVARKDQLDKLKSVVEGLDRSGLGCVPVSLEGALKRTSWVAPGLGRTARGAARGRGWSCLDS